MNLELLNHYIKNSHLTIRDLAGEINVNEKTLYNWLKTNKIDSKHLADIFTALRLTNEQILKLFK